MPNTIGGFQDVCCRARIPTPVQLATGAAQLRDELSREVFGVLGIPIDVLGLPAH